MSLNPEAAWKDVYNKVVATVPAAIKVYESKVPEDADLTLTNGLFTPFVVVYYGGPVRSGTDHSIVSSRYDTTILYWTVATYAPTSDATAAITGQIIDALAGYYPVDCGEVMLEGGTSYSRASNAVRPTQYIKEIGFSARSNLSA